MNGPVICGIEDVSGAGVAGVARELAERYDLPLVFVHVLDGAGEAEQAARLLYEAVAPGDGELAVESGHHPADRLVEIAKQRDASFLVVGNHGPHSSLLGSISADVSRRAPCPVVVVPPRPNLPSAGPPPAKKRRPTEESSACDSESPYDVWLEAAMRVEGRAAL